MWCFGPIRTNYVFLHLANLSGNIRRSTLAQSAPCIGVLLRRYAYEHALLYSSVPRLYLYAICRCRPGGSIAASRWHLSHIFRYGAELLHCHYSLRYGLQQSETSFVDGSKEGTRHARKTTDESNLPNFGISVTVEIVCFISDANCEIYLAYV